MQRHIGRSAMLYPRDDARDRDGREDRRACVYDERDRDDDPREGLMRDLDLPRGEERELVATRDRVYELDGEDIRVCAPSPCRRIAPPACACSCIAARKQLGHLAMKGAPVRAIQEVAGHRDLATTQRYMHLGPSAVADAIRLLDGPSIRGDSGETAIR
jgi:hypothetical protein